MTETAEAPLLVGGTCLAETSPITGPVLTTLPLGRPAGYLPIAEHGVVGDLHSAALVASDGTIDWYSPDRFDAPTVFAALLDRNRGGYYRIAPANAFATTKQLYLPDTNVLITRFLSPEGVSEIQDFMPVGGGGQQLVRRMLGVRGVLRFRLEIEPRFCYGLQEPQVAIEAGGAVFRTSGQVLALGSPVALERTDAGAMAEFELSAGDRRTFVLERGEHPMPLSESRAQQLRNETVTFWRDWLGQSSYQGRWREMVHRSALTLKLLCYRETGAIVAAATTSLPERVGGSRNWDYRYAWLRDFTFSIYALSRLGFTSEARAFNSFRRALLRGAISRDGESPLQVMYRIDGDSHLGEQELTNPVTRSAFIYDARS